MAYYLVGSLALALLFITKRIYSYILFLRLQKKNGCKPVVEFPQRETILGYDLYTEQMNSMRNNTILPNALKRYRKLGNTWKARMFGADWYNTIEPENVKFMLATNFKDFNLGLRKHQFGALLGDGIFTSDGADWEHSRALVRPNFVRSQVADLNTFEKHIQILISKIPRDGSTFDLQKVFFQLTLDSATEFLFGESVHSLSSKEGSEEQRFGIAFDSAQREITSRSRSGKLGSIFRALMFRSDNEFVESCKIVHSFVDRFVHSALEKVQPTDAEKVIDGDGSPERYIFLNEMAKGTRDPIRLRAELLNILLAGRDTTASLLSHTFFVLARRPDIWKNLTAEVDELHGERPSYETLKDMKYLKNLLSESLRLYPVVPLNARMAGKSIVVPLGGGPDGRSPFLLPAGSILTYSTFVMHRRKDIYGPDADEFRPDRWRPEEGLRPGWAYLPFNGGPRICVGQQFALTEASYTIVRLVQEFKEVINKEPEKEWTEQLGLTLAVGGGVKVGVVSR